jgi:hypothetical protein
LGPDRKWRSSTSVQRSPIRSNARPIGQKIAPGRGIDGALDWRDAAPPTLFAMSSISIKY